MKTRFLIPSCLLLALSSLPAREFTDTQGRKLEAEIVSVSGDAVALLRAGEKRPLSAKIAIFSDADQKFIREWAAVNIKYNFEVRHEKKKVGETKIDEGGLVGTMDKWAYVVTLKNMSGVTTPGLTVKYWVFGREMAEKGRMTARVASSGSSKLEELAHNKAATVETSSVEAPRVRAKPGYYFKSGESNKNGQAAGFALRIYNEKGTEVFSHATDESYLAAAR